MNPLELMAQAKARRLAEEAAARATQGGDPAALDATMGAPPLSEPRVPRQPSESQLAERQFAQTPMHQFMQQRDEPGGMSSPTEFAGQMSNSGQLASGAGSGMPKNVLQMMIDKRKQLDAPRTPDPNVVAQARAKYADEARQNANAASGAYGGMAGDMAMGGGGPSLPGALSLIPRGGMRPMNAREMIAYDGQRNRNALDVVRTGIARDQFNRQAKRDDAADLRANQGLDLDRQRAAFDQSFQLNRAKQTDDALARNLGNDAKKLELDKRAADVAEKKAASDEALKKAEVKNKADDNYSQAIRRYQDLQRNAAETGILLNARRQKLKEADGWLWNDSNMGQLEADVKELEAAHARELKMIEEQEAEVARLKPR